MTKSKDTIRVLSERQQCRDKVSIWFGSRDNFIHPFKECLANAIDEINNNFDSGEIKVFLNDNRITVVDSGRGIPIDGKTQGIDNYHLLLLKLFAGTNYDNGINKKTATGTNGVGLTVTNYCSTHFMVKSYQKDKIAYIKFKNGGDIDEPLKVWKKTKEDSDFTGTIVEYELDRAVFGDYKYNVEEIKEIIKACAGVSNKIKFTFQCGNELPIVYHYENLYDYFMHLSESNTCKPILGLPKLYENEVVIPNGGGENMALQNKSHSENITIKEEDTIELVLTTSPDTIQQSFLNITYLQEGGTINDGVIVGVRDFANKYLEGKKMLDKKLGKLTVGDVEGSISFVCNFMSTVVEFANQTKLSTNKSLYRKVASEYTKEILELELVRNPKNIEKMIKHILEVQSFNSKAVAAKKKLRASLSEKVDGIANALEGLVDCKYHGEGSELFIAEGKSALGSIILSRDANFQAGIPIRGKITNVLKKSFTEILDSPTVISIIRALGCGIETDKKNKDLGEFDEKALRYGKIMIATDMDSDGYQIQCLLLTLFYKLTPTLLKNGRVYIVNTPLYEVRLKDDTDIYWYSEVEREEYLRTHGDSKISHIARAKGLGELEAEVMAMSGVNPETRNITQVKVEDVEAMVEAFEKWMGEDVADRKATIESELNKYSIED